MTEQLRIPLIGERVSVGEYEGEVVRHVPADTWVDVPEHPAKVRIPPAPHERVVLRTDRHTWTCPPVSSLT